jgi:hypothetical protein
MNDIFGNVWPYTGQVYEVPRERAEQIPLLRHVKGLSEIEYYMILGMINLSATSDENRTDQKSLKKYLQGNDRPLADATIKLKVISLFESGVFERYEVPRPKTRPAVVYKLRDIAELVQSDTLHQRESELTKPKPAFDGRTIIPEDAVLLEGNDDHEHAYSRKVNHIIMRRCSGDPTHLGKKIPIVLPGMGETVHVIQRTASGIPPMDGSQDRLQQVLLTMFKEHLAKFRTQRPDIDASQIENEWLIDMREVCRSMKLVPSSGNILVQAKKLYQLRYNTFEIHFDPDGQAAKAFNFLAADKLKAVYHDETENTLHSLTNERIDQYFLGRLEPIRDEIVWAENQKALEFGEEKSTKQHNTFSIDDKDLYYDATGRLFRFYRVSFHHLVFKECLNDALGQIHKQPPSILEEDRPIARHLVYLAQRIIGKFRDRPFEANWGDIAEEIQPLQDNQKLVFQGMEKVFKSELAKAGETWKPQAGETQVISLHGYLFETYVPGGKQRKRAKWKLKIARDVNHPYVGNSGPAAYAAQMASIKASLIARDSRK